MAKTSLKNKQQATPKYSTRAYTRCRLCGRPHSVLRKYGICRVASANSPTRVRFPVFVKPAGKKEDISMLVTDPIADMLTRIRNALIVKHDTVDVPVSVMKLAIADILLNEGYIKGYTVGGEGVQKMMTITLKYGANRQKVITGLKRISKPGLRVYARKDNIPKGSQRPRHRHHFHFPRHHDRSRSKEAGRRRRSSRLRLVTTRKRESNLNSLRL